MKQFKSFGLVVVTLLFSVTMAFAAKPNIHILATGGTIAGTGSSATASPSWKKSANSSRSWSSMLPR